MPSRASSTILSILEFVSIGVLIVASVRCVFKKLYPRNDQTETETTSRTIKVKKKRKRHISKMSPL